MASTVVQILDTLQVTHTIGSPNSPSADTDGIDIADAQGLRIVLSAESGQTITAAGVLDFYLYDYTLARWVLNPDLQISIGTGGARDITFSDMAIFCPWGRLYVKPSSAVAASGGTTVVVTHVLYRGR